MLLTTVFIPVPVLLRPGFPSEFTVVVQAEQVLAFESESMCAANAEPPLLLRLVRSTSTMLSTTVLLCAKFLVLCRMLSSALVTEQFRCMGGMRSPLLPVMEMDVLRVTVVTCGSCVRSDSVMLTLRRVVASLGLLLKVQSRSAEWVSMPTTESDLAACGNRSRQFAGSL